MFLELLLLAFSAIFSVYLIQSKKKPKNYPPGPFSWPILGNLPQVGLQPHKTVMKMKEKYGGIIGIDLGLRRTVFINDHKLLKEAFNLPALNGRAWGSHFIDPHTGHYEGVFFTSGQKWVEQRKFTFAYIQAGLRNGATMESLVKEETAGLIKEIRKTCGQSIRTQYLFNIASINSLWAIVAGKKYSLNDQNFQKFFKIVAPFFSARALYFAEFYPGLSARFPTMSGIKNIKESLRNVLDFLQDEVEEHKKTYNEEIRRDLIDAYLHKINSTTDANSSFYGKTGEINLVYNMLDLFAGGTLSVAATLRWAVFLLAHFSDVQKKLISYIQLQIGKDHVLTLSDRTQLPYIQAVIQEVLRFTSLTPLGVFHGTLEDTNLHGYHIPKGTAIFPNQYAILHDPEVWGDPENFRPERFLNEDETEAIRHEALVPFGVGRRVCPGESFAREELFLFITSIFQNFEVSFDPSVPMPPVDNVVGHASVPVHHQVVFRELVN